MLFMKRRSSACQATLIGLGSITLAAWAVAQEAIPSNILVRRVNMTNETILSWAAIPGRTYVVRTRDGMDAPWLTTGLPSVKAQSTRASSNSDIVTPGVPVRFFQIQAQAVPTGNTNPITSTTVAELETALGLTFTPAQRSQMLNALSSSRATYETMRKIRLLNSDSPALVFDPLPDGFRLETTQNPIMWTRPKRTTVPVNRAELAFYTVRDLGELIRSRQVTATELTELYLARLKAHDGILHCVITFTEELALNQAARADREIAEGKYRGPLHGIPYGIKDLFSARGYRTTWGAAPFKDQVIDEDATVVRKLEAAGAVLIAKLSTGELANGDGWFGGQTKNPWNVSQGSSGSSAGPAAAASAGLVAFSIGTETWGSIASPCTVCRITGLRTTFGRISRSGAMSLNWSMDKIGPICRDVEDCAIILDAIRGPDGIDRAAADLPFNYAPNQDLKRLRVGYRQGNLSSAVLNLLSDIVGPENLVSVTLPATPVNPLLILRVEAATAFDELTRFGGDSLLQTGWPQLFRVGRAIPAVEYLQADRLRKKLIQDMAELMREIDVYVGTQNEIVGGEANGISNLTGQPCVFIPHGGETSLGFIGRPFDEATILALAKAYQDGTPYHTNHPPAFIK